jgi:hypothetical protein
MKRTIKTLLVLIIIFSLTTTVFAAESVPIEPFWDNTNEIVSAIDLNGANSSAYAKIIGKTDTTKIEAVLSVYISVNGEWILVNQSTRSSNLYYLSFSVNFVAENGATYKSILVVHVTNSSGVTESIQRARYAIN